ncbi:MAG TPA: class I SAM-dependent methyltransferase [Polyangiaceae bacterium]|nr:class I SAM-dependent methyltransferase [Polyangiaceae bacterium]
MTSGAVRFFDAIVGRYDRVYALSSAESRVRLARVISHLPPAPARLLDLGVGTGRELPALLDAGYAVTGLDASQPMLEKCARRARPIPLVHADFWRLPLPFEPASFDAAVALHGTLAHPPGPDAVSALGRDLARVVRSGGTFVAEVPSPAWLDVLDRAGPPPEGTVRRTGPRACVYEDQATGATIEARLLDATEWRAAFDRRAGWECRVEPAGDVEWIVVARRT